MVSVGISKLGCTDLVFVDQGVKINGAYYRDVLLSKQLLVLPVTREVLGNFRQRSFHRIFGGLAIEQPWLQDLERRPTASVVYQSRVYNTDELKQCVQQVCNVDESIIDNAVA